MIAHLVQMRMDGMWWKLPEFGTDAVYYRDVELTGVSRCRNARPCREDWS